MRLSNITTLLPPSPLQKRRGWSRRGKIEGGRVRGVDAEEAECSPSPTPIGQKFIDPVSLPWRGGMGPETSLRYPFKVTRGILYIKPPLHLCCIRPYEPCPFLSPPPAFLKRCCSQNSAYFRIIGPVAKDENNMYLFVF